LATNFQSVLRFIGFLALLLISLSTFAQSEWTLKSCLEHAASNNIQIKQAEIQAKIAKNNVLQSILNFGPSANLNSGYNFNFGNSIDPTTFTFVRENSQSLTLSFNSNLTLFNGLQKINTYNRNKAELEAAKYDAENTLNNTALQITNLYLQTLLNEELREVAKKQMDISENQLSRAKTQAKAGTLAEASLHEFEAQLARDNASFTQAKYNALYSLLQLKLSLQLPDTTSFEIKAPELSKTAMLTNTTSQTVFNTALYNQPSIKSAQARIASARFTRKIALGAFSPTLSFVFNMSDNYFNKAVNFVTREPITLATQFKNNFSKVAGFSFSLPIFTGGSRLVNTQNTKLQEQSRMLELDNQKNQLRQTIEQAYNNVKASFETLLANEKAKVAARRSFESYEKRYEVGLANTFELQQSSTNLFRAESQYLQAKYTYLLNQKVLEFYEGKPLSLE